MNQALFRKQALDSQSEKLCGELILSQPLSTTVLVAFLVGITALSLFFLGTATYARKVSVPGVLQPNLGVLEQTAPATGQISRIFVEPEQLVQAGVPLFELRLDHTLDNDSALSELLLSKLQQQEESLQRQLHLQDETLANINSGHAEQDSLLQATGTQLEQMLNQEQALAEVKQKALQRVLALQQKGMLAVADVETVQAQAMQQEQACFQLQLQLLQNRTRLQDMHNERASLLLQSLQQSERLAAELG